MQALRLTTRISALFCVVFTTPALAQFAGLFGTDVPTIGVDELVAALRDSNTGTGELADERRAVLLVDVRSPRETGVSIIPGAVTRDAYERNAAAYEGYLVVPYCTVGVRSERYTRALRKKGVDAVNFEGSIMAWVEAGLPLVTLSGEPTRRVHTWSRRFSVPADYVQVTE
jgi:rhodanese-related sulfurtransferase